MRLLRETLQKRVMTMIGEVTDDVEEVSQRQMEANQFRSQILREVMEILQSEIPEEDPIQPMDLSIHIVVVVNVYSMKWIHSTRRLLFLHSKMNQCF